MHPSLTTFAYLPTCAFAFTAGGFAGGASTAAGTEQTTTAFFNLAVNLAAAHRFVDLVGDVARCHFKPRVFGIQPRPNLVGKGADFLITNRCQIVQTLDGLGGDLLRFGQFDQG